MKLTVPALGAVLALVAVPAHAQFSFDTSGALREGWYVAPMFTYTKADAKRCTDDGKGATVAIGDKGHYAGLEFGLSFTDLPFNCAKVGKSGTAKQVGTELSAVIGPFTDIPVLRQTYGVAGLGAVKHSDYPRFANDDTSFFADVGAGYLQPFTAFGWGATLRAEARYRWEHEQPPHFNNSPAAFRDIVINLGLQIPLFGSEAPAAVPPPAENVAVVPATEPAPAPAPEAQPPAAEPAPAPVEAPPKIETAKAGETIVLEGVTFNSSKATLTEGAKTVLDKVAVQLTQRGAMKVEIGGHTDSSGKKMINQKLSQKRAQAVFDYLVLKGVDAGRLSAVGYGDSQPVESNDTPAGRERNRRVEMKVTEQASEPEPAAPRHGPRS